MNRNVLPRTLWGISPSRSSPPTESLRVASPDTSQGCVCLLARQRTHEQACVSDTARVSSESERVASRVMSNRRGEIGTTWGGPRSSARCPDPATESANIRGGFQLLWETPRGDNTCNRGDCIRGGFTPPLGDAAPTRGVGYDSNGTHHLPCITAARARPADPPTPPLLPLDVAPRAHAPRCEPGERTGASACVYGGDRGRLSTISELASCMQ